ncbi:hypothetical protein ACFL35_06600 [Candidatus Riflebacteria bacterium]
MWNKGRFFHSATLIEVTVATLVMVLLFGGVYKVFYSARRLHTKVTSELTVNQDCLVLAKKLMLKINEANYIEGKNPPFLDAAELKTYKTSDPRNRLVLVKQRINFKRKPSQGFYEAKKYDISVAEIPPKKPGGEKKYKLILKISYYDYKGRLKEEKELVASKNLSSIRFYRLKKTEGNLSFSSKSIHFDMKIKIKGGKGNKKVLGAKGNWEGIAFIRGERI